MNEKFTQIYILINEFLGVSVGYFSGSIWPLSRTGYHSHNLKYNILHKILIKKNTYLVILGSKDAKAFLMDLKYSAVNIHFLTQRFCCCF